MGLTRREHIIIRLSLLQNLPHPLNIVPRMAPIALGIQIAKKECLLSTELNSGHRTADFSSDKSFAADRAFVIEQDTIRSMKAVGLAVIYRDPIGIQFCRCIRRARVKRCGLPLGSFLHVAV